MSYLPTQGTGVGIKPSGVSLTAPVTLAATSMWTLNDTGRKADITTGFTGAAAYAFVTGDPVITITCPKDDTLDPEIAGLQKGVIIPYLYLYTVAPTWNTTTGAVITHGSATLVRNTYVEGVETTYDSTADVGRLRISLAGGKTYRNVTPITPNVGAGQLLP